MKQQAAKLQEKFESALKDAAEKVQMLDEKGVKASSTSAVAAVCTQLTESEQENRSTQVEPEEVLRHEASLEEQVKRLQEERDSAQKNAADQARLVDKKREELNETRAAS